MTWLTPALAGIAAAVAIPTLLILYFLKLRRREVEVSSTLLWKKSIRDLQANAPFQRLRRNLLLLLQMLILMLALAALAQPLWRSTTPPGGRSVILIDRSASMSALDETNESNKPETRLDHAKRDALTFIDSLSDGGIFHQGSADEAMVIAFDSSAQVLQPYTTSKQRLRDAVRAVEPTDAPTHLDEAMRLAGAYTRTFQEDRGLIAGAGPPIYLWTDGVFSDSDRVTIPPETRIEYRAVGKPDTPNLAITAIRASRAFDKPTEASIFVGLQSTDSAPRAVDVQLAADGVVTAVRSITLPPASAEAGPSSAGVIFRLDRDEGAVVSARLLSTDALPADDQARLVLSPARRLAVGVVTRGNLFLKAALEGLPLSRLDLLTPEAFQSLVNEGRQNQYEVFILDSWIPPPPASLPPGAYLIFNALPSIPGFVPRDQSDSPDVSVVTNWDRDHPALSHITLENLYIARPILLESSEAIRALATGHHGPVILESTDSAVHALVVAFDIARSNWPYDIGFVLFMASSIRYLGDEGASLASDSATPGGTLTTRLPAGVGQATVTLPDGSTATALAGPDGRVSFGPVARAGVYTFSWVGPPGPRDPIINSNPRRAIPVNLTDALESRLGAKPTLDLPAGAIPAVATGALAHNQELSTWFLLAVLLVMLIEWWFYHRRVRL